MRLKPQTFLTSSDAVTITKFKTLFLQIIRQELTDKREQHYESKGIGCYMFRMDDTYVVDATVMGSAARFINHSCEPNCYSRIVHVEGKNSVLSLGVPDPVFTKSNLIRGSAKF